MKLVTPGRGTLALSAEDDDPRLFRLARVGLGALGVVSEVTLQLAREHTLLEHTYVASAKVGGPALGSWFPSKALT
jgi:L-galactono-1,4-lactone dehydrogenase